MVKSLQFTALARDRTMSVANAPKFEEVELNVKGEIDEELTAWLVVERLSTGLMAVSTTPIDGRFFCG